MRTGCSAGLSGRVPRPFAWFAVRRRIPPGYAMPLVAIFVLGGLQGAAGRYMVANGLVDDPRVSQ